MQTPKCYLGDGAYAHFEGYQICLTTSDGITTTNIIYVEKPALVQLIKFAKHNGWTMPEITNDSGQTPEY